MGDSVGLGPLLGVAEGREEGTLLRSYSARRGPRPSGPPVAVQNSFPRILSTVRSSRLRSLALRGEWFESTCLVSGPSVEQERATEWRNRAVELEEGGRATR